MVSEESPACSKSSQGGYFKGEIIPVEAPQADGSVITVDSDQSIRPDTSLEKIASLPPAFKPGGVITAGNSSPLNAGATGLLLASKRKVQKLGLEPLAKIVTYGTAGVPPYVMCKECLQVERLWRRLG